MKFSVASHPCNCVRPFILKNIRIGSFTSIAKIMRKNCTVSDCLHFQLFDHFHEWRYNSLSNAFFYVDAIKSIYNIKYFQYLFFRINFNQFNKILFIPPYLCKCILIASLFHKRRRKRHKTGGDVRFILFGIKKTIFLLLSFGPIWDIPVLGKKK